MDINENKVHHIIDMMKKRGEAISKEKIRKYLGNKGSYTTITKYINTHKDKLKEYPKEFLKLKKNIEIIEKSFVEIFYSIKIIEQILSKRLRANHMTKKD